MFINHIKSKNIEDLMVASPDIGGVARARYFASRLGVEMAIVDKRREKANESEVMNIIGDVKGKNIVLVDDMIDTAGTIVKGAKALKEHGAKSVIACCTHPVLSGPAYDRIRDGELDELIVSDTLPLTQACEKITVLPAAPIFAEVIRRVYHNESVNSLFA